MKGQCVRTDVGRKRGHLAGAIPVPIFGEEGVPAEHLEFRIPGEVIDPKARGGGADSMHQHGRGDRTLSAPLRSYYLGRQGRRLHPAGTNSMAVPNSPVGKICSSDPRLLGKGCASWGV